jgi:alpha-tubulin suppressor-like RCC1 family protein
MKRAFLTLALLLPVLSACGDQLMAPVRTAPQFGISDGTRGGNPHFFWLAPVVAQPKGRTLGTFDAKASPTLRLRCLSTNQPGLTCNPDVTLLEATVGDGIQQAPDHYAVGLVPSALGVATTTVNGQRRTVYRLEVLTPELPVFGSVPLGFMDVVFAERQADANRLTTADAVGIAMTGTAPVRFRVDRGALVAAVQDEPANTGDEAFCEIRCSVTVIDPDEPTLATLAGAAGLDVTGILFEPGALSAPAVLIIDERDASDPESCAPGTVAQKRNCFRYALHPQVSFNVDVRVGICPAGVVLGPGTLWRLLKWSDGVVTRIPDIDVRDFLPCTPQVGLLRGAWDRLAGALVRPLYAGDTRHWGGTIRDLSDLFWAAEADLIMESLPTEAEAGSTVPVTIRALAAHPREHDPEAEVPLPGLQLSFAITSGSGQMAPAAGTTLAGPPTVTDDGRVIGLTVLTGADGRATVSWTVAAGSNGLNVGVPGGSAAEATAALTGTTEPPPVITMIAAPAPTASVELTASVAPRVSVTDASGAPLPGVPVTFVVTAGGGTVTGATVLTDALGQASVGSWTMGPTPTRNRIEAQVGGASAAAEVWTTWTRRLVTSASSSCALTLGGALYCWGDNSRWHLTLTAATMPSSASPFLSSLTGLTALSKSDGLHICALSGQQSICWGSAFFGQLGHSAGVNPALPDLVGGGIQWASTSASRLSSCGVSTTGEAYCWGTNSAGEVGNPTVELRQNSPLPVPVDGGLTFREVVAGWLHACGITTTGATWCWGDNRQGQLGIGTTETERRSPAPVAGGHQFVQLTLGSVNTCGITADNVALCWGANSTGQLGDGTTVGRAVPTPVAGGRSFTAITLSGAFPTEPPAPAVPVQGGAAHACALTAAGQAYCWGLNAAGQLGNGSLTDSLTPVPVSGGLTFSALALGASHTCGMRGSSIHCWGSNGSGQLGNGSTTPTPLPAPVLPPFGAIIP